MKKLLALLVFVPSFLFAQSPFDGTWVSDPEAAQFSKKPHTYTLEKGMYACSTCVPKISVKADGTDQAVSGSNYFNTVAIREVDANTIEEVYKKDGKTMYKDTVTVSADGKTLTDKFEDDSEDKPVTGDDDSLPHQQRTSGFACDFGLVAYGEGGEHVEQWPDRHLQSTPNGMKYSDNNGQSYDVKFDGKDYPIQGDPGQTMVSLKKVDANTLEETDKRNGKVV